MAIENLPQRKLHRLKDYDYSQNGYYFITICTHKKKNILGNIVGNAVPGVPKVVPTEIGKIVECCWERMSSLDVNIKTDCFCLMPNHIHGIIVIENSLEAERRGRRSLQELVRGFKSVTTRYFNALVSEKDKNTLWQTSFYDKVIRNEQALFEIREYIINNPLKWNEDEYYK